MPLRDHFRSPLDDHHSWDELHGSWPTMLVLQSGKLLPPEYYAAPQIHLGGSVEDVDEYEVWVYDVKHERRLVAAIEIVSPSNKDRAATRQQFVSKCASLLRQDVSVTIVDLVTTRDFNLYAELLALQGRTDATVSVPPSNTYAVSCRLTKPGKQELFEAWHVPLTIGHALPTLPIWLSDNLAVSVDLEASYEDSCRAVRIA